MPTCYYNYSTLPPNGGLTFEFTGHDIEYTIKPENAVYNVSKIEFHTVGFQLMCNKSFLCSEVRVNQSENSLSVNCELEPGIGNFNVEIQIFITGDCGSDRTAIIFVYGKLKSLFLYVTIHDTAGTYWSMQNVIFELKITKESP